MLPTAKSFTAGLAVVLLFLLLAPPTQAQIADPPDKADSQQDLFLLGFGELTLHSLSVEGNDSRFEAANPTLEDGFSSNYRMSLFANGHALSGFNINGAAVVDSRISEEYRTFDPSVFRLKMSIESTEPIWDSWRFTGHGNYDPARLWKMGNLDSRLLTTPQESSRLELLMRLESDEHGLVEAGSIRPSFKESKFTLHQRSVFGLYADLHTGALGAEAVAGKLEGKSFREGSVEGIRADGTSGPFILAKAPITRGSEEVKIEVRDRFDESTVLETRTLLRDVDYNVDNLRGQVLLHRPVASETISSDPVYIVITFDFLRPENDELYGGRAHLTPVDGLTVSGSYLHREIEPVTNPTTIAGAVDEPENLIAADANLKLGDHTTGFFEVAGSEDQNSTDDYSALRVGLKSEIISGLTLKGTFQKIDDKFNSFTNSDLNPTKNQQRLHLGGQFKLTKDQTITASFANNRGLEANGKFNNYAGLKNEDVYSLGYKNQLIDQFGFGVRVERREVNDRQNALNEDTKRERAIVDLGGKFTDLPLLGKLAYKASYELDMFRNELNIGEHDSDKNQLTASIISNPNDRMQLELGQRLSIRKDITDSVTNYDNRQDASFAKLQFKLAENLNTFTTLEYIRYTIPGETLHRWQDDPTRTQWAGTFALEYLPLDKFKFVAKSGRHQANAWLTDTTGRAPSDRVTTDFLLGQLTYFHTHHLSFNAESEFRQEQKRFTTDSRSKVWDLGLRANWNRDRLNEMTAGLIRRWVLEQSAGGSDVTPTTYIFLLSGSVSVTSDFFARASLKNVLLNETVDDVKTFTKLEVGYDGRSWYRVSLGYERIESDNDSDPGTNYIGQGVFVRLSGKL